VRRQDADRRGGRRRQRRTLTLQQDLTAGDREDVATLIRAVVHARLLGIRLLTLDARVVVANDVDTSDGLAVPDRLTLVAPDPGAVPLEGARRTRRTSSDAPAPAVRVVEAGDVTTARELLAEGADTLERAWSGDRREARWDRADADG
jgi:hypothetical protein